MPRALADPVQVLEDREERLLARFAQESLAARRGGNARSQKSVQNGVQRLHLKLHLEKVGFCGWIRGVVRRGAKIVVPHTSSHYALTTVENDSVALATLALARLRR